MYCGHRCFTCVKKTEGETVSCVPRERYSTNAWSPAITCTVSPATPHHTRRRPAAITTTILVSLAEIKEHFAPALQLAVGS